MYNTDKQDGGLLEHYESMFSNLRNTEIKYLEIGILEGESLRWARDFFYKGIIYGVDIKLPILDFKGVNLIECSQENKKDLEKLSDYGLYDIIIDDASHYKYLTLQTFNVLWNFVKKDGWYIIEDWTAGYSDLLKYKGLEEVITEILLNQEKYQFTDVRIISEKKSFAAFKK